MGNRITTYDPAHIENKITGSPIVLKRLNLISALQVFIFGAFNKGYFS